MTAVLEEIRDYVNSEASDPTLREAIRALLLANNGIEADVAGASPRLSNCQQRLVFRARPPVVAAVATALADGSFSRLKACRADDCRWAFIDTARNRSRQWCDMTICGNRAKARRYRDRHA